jgi:hypothetical protein
MTKSSIIVNKEASIVKHQLESLFCDAFSCSSNEVYSKQHKTKRADGSELIQTLTAQENGLTLTSLTGKDTVSTIYQIDSLDGSSSRLTLTETAHSEVKSRQLNYTFFSLPVIELFTKKKLKRNLAVLKYRIENGVENAHR